MISAYKTGQELQVDAAFELPSWARSHAAAGRQARDDLKLELITTVSEFLKLERDWTVLFEQSAKSHQVFQGFNWLAHWSASYIDAVDQDSNISLAIITGRLNDELVMVWPLVERQFAGVRTFEWMGGPVSQYGDVLVAEHKNTTAWLQAGFEFIKSQIRPDAIVLSNVRGDSQFARYFPIRSLSRLRVQEAPYVDLGRYKSFSDFRSAYSKRTRKTRSRKRRRFMEEPNVGRDIFEHGTCSPELTNDVLALKRRWLDDRSSASRAFSNKKFDNFMTRAVTSRAHPVNALVTVLSIDRNVVAGEIGFCQGTRYVSHVAAYDLNTARLSPGVLQFEDTIERCFQNGIATVDLLAPADPYKMEWATGVVDIADYAAPLTFKGHIAVLMRKDGLRTLLRKASTFLPASLRSRIAHVAAKFL